MQLKVTEAQTQKAVLEVLAAHNIFAFRLNTAAMRVGERFFRAHSLGPGTADILAFPLICEDCVRQDGRHGHVYPLWLEVKSPGKKQRPEQVSFQSHVEALGHTYLLVDSVDQVIQFIKEHCL
jgi:hypothetical protein